MRLLFVFLLLLLQHDGYGQRSGRRTYIANSAYVTYKGPAYSGRCSDITLINNDTLPVLLRLGPVKRIRNNDTVNLARIYPCNDPSREHYDLDYPGDWEASCVRWYSLQLIKPRDTLHFTVRLLGSADADSAKLYFCFTKEITRQDTDLKLYSDPKTVYIMQDERDFKTRAVNLSTAEPKLIWFGSGE